MTYTIDLPDRVPALSPADLADQNINVWIERAAGGTSMAGLVFDHSVTMAVWDTVGDEAEWTPEVVSDAWARAMTGLGYRRIGNQFRRPQVPARKPRGWRRIPIH